jgi:hypothetical protein
MPAQIAQYAVALLLALLTLLLWSERRRRFARRYRAAVSHALDPQWFVREPAVSEQTLPSEEHQDSIAA